MGYASDDYKNRVGETSIHKSTGLKMTIIEYKDSSHVTVQFEDGTIAKNKTYRSFQLGNIGYNNNKEHIGEKMTATNGLEMTIIKYRGSTDVDVQFEDGTIVRHRDYGAFQKGNIRCTGVDSYHNESETRIGEESIASNGMKMTVVGYRNANDLDVMFEDGSVVKRRSYRRFKDGSIKHPTIKRSRVDKEKYIGKTLVNNYNEKMTIIDCDDNKRITVRFEDGTVREKVSYESFAKGILTAQKYNDMQNKRKSRLGLEKVAHNGMPMKIIEYKSSKNMTIKFKDGTVVNNVTWQAFKQGYVRNSNLKKGDNNARR